MVGFLDQNNSNSKTPIGGKHATYGSGTKSYVQLQYFQKMIAKTPIIKLPGIIYPV